MRDWVVTDEGDRWTAKFDARDLGTLAERVRVVIARLVLIFVLPQDFHVRLRIVQAMFIPAGLHGVEAFFLADDCLRKLRSAVFLLGCLVSASAFGLCGCCS